MGPYILREQIGEGGFGQVFVAEQTAPVRRKVALKLIKLGMETQEVIARFEAERQALAMMDHPHIAKVFDAGTTDTGRPYFVMELIRGMPITKFCREKKLDLREQLKLFVDVCRAVQHAHQKGIIHRDLKPSNIMITLHDGVPVVKVIDFGIAKALYQKLTEQTVYTRHAQMVGTPMYMSPEQAELSGLDVDTRSDVYSLGVLLYELLTGMPPFDQETLMSKGFDEMRRIIREDDPPRPSHRISTLDASMLSTLQKERGLDTRQFSHALKRELDWIVMKALEKRRNRRYESASDLAADVERYLADEAVTARPQSGWYRLRKFTGRNRTALLTLTLVACALLLGTAVSVWQAVRATRAQQLSEEREQRANTEASKANAIADLMQRMIASGDPDSGKGRDYTVRAMLNHFSKTLSDSPPAEPEVEAQLRLTIGGAFQRLGLIGEAEPHLLRAVELRRQIFGESHPALAESLIAYAWNLYERGRYAESEATATEVLAICDEVGSDSNLIIHALRIQQLSARDQDRIDVANQAARRAISFDRNASLSSEGRRHLASIMHVFASSLSWEGNYEEAIAVARRAVDLHLEVNGKEHVETAWGRSTLGRILLNQNHPQEAEQEGRTAIAAFRTHYAEDHKSIRWALNLLTDALLAQGKVDEALAEWSETLERRQRRFGDAHETVIAAYVSRGKILERANRQTAADTEYQLAAAACRILLASNPTDPDLLYKLGELQSRLREHDEAWATMGAAIARVEQDSHRLERTDSLYLAAALAVLRDPNADHARLEQAAAWAQLAVDAESFAARYRCILGIAQCRLERWNDAVQSFASTERQGLLHHYNGADYWNSLAHWKLGDKERAQSLFDRAEASSATHKLPDPKRLHIRNKVASIFHGMARLE